MESYLNVLTTLFKCFDIVEFQRSIYFKCLSYEFFISNYLQWNISSCKIWRN